MAYLQYTSGSTSTPKGVMVTHGNLAANLDMLAVSCDHPADATLASWLPMFHDMGLVTKVLLPVYLGLHGVLMSPTAFLQKPLRWLSAISQWRADTSGGPNFAYELCVRRIKPEETDGLDLSSWRIAFNGAEPVRPQTVDRFVEAFQHCGFRRRSMVPVYGLAEATLFVSGTRPRENFVLSVDPTAFAQHRLVPDHSDSAHRLISCGQPWLDEKVAVVEPETGTRCESGQVGEIWLSGSHIGAGYWKRPDVTEEVFHARLPDGDGPYLRTGDLGAVWNGEIVVTGRLKDLIIIRGRNHYPHDIEHTVQACHPAFRPDSGAAFSIDVDGDEKLAVVQEVTDVPDDLDAVFSAVRRAVAESHELETHAISLVHKATMPKTSSGKIQRRACRSAFLEGTLREVGRWTQGKATRADQAPSVPAANRIEAWLSKWLQDNTGQTFSPQRAFLEYGLDSLRTTTLVHELSEWLGTTLDVALAWDYPTPAALAAHLSGEREIIQSPAAATTEPIAVVGVGCRFPGGVHGPDAFWQRLLEGFDGVGEVPSERWDVNAWYDPDPEAKGKMVTRWGGFLRDIDRFDASFFGIAPREAVSMDPQQRLLLETSWEALENAGQAPDRLMGTRTGVFVGICGSDYLDCTRPDPSNIDAWTMTGSAASIAAGRVSYLLGLKGPSLAVDTACSSSLLAIHLACQSLRAGECDLALAGGVNLVLSPEGTVYFSRVRAMSPTGRCHTFDASADGYVRAEGCGVVALKPLSAAQRDGDRILAVIRGSAANQDGRSNGLTAPNGPSQEAVIRDALTAAGVAPHQVGYVETHGTGTPLGDPIEVKALAGVFAADRNPERPLRIGSVKTNIGHTEGAAGVAGFIKAALAVHHGTIPAHNHFKTPSPHIPWHRWPVQVPTKPSAWQEDGPRVAGVSSFGFSGTNVHVVMEQPPVADVPATPSRPVHLLPLSASTETALRELADGLAPVLKDDTLADACSTMARGRAALTLRAFVVGASAAEMVRGLGGLSAEKVVEGVVPRVGFLLTGQGSQYAGMGKTLYADSPVFRAAIDRCAAGFDPLLGTSLLEVLQDDSRLRDTTGTQPALFALEWALCELWRSWGIVPHGLVGHSVGELVAATIAGVFSLDDAIRLVAARARLMGALPTGGAMLSVAAAEARVLPIVGDRVDVAAVNAADQTVISGTESEVLSAAARLQEAGLSTTRLDVSHAFHSRLMDPMLAEFRAICQSVQFSPPQIPLYSTSVGRLDDPEYWVQQIRQPVRFAPALNAMVGAGVHVLLEVGPKPVLLGLVGRAHPDVKGLPSLRPKRDEWRTLLTALGTLWVRGATVDWAAFDGPRRRLALPTYPFQRQRYWAERGAIRESSAGHPLVGVRTELPEGGNVFAFRLSLTRFPWLGDHRVFGVPVVPGAAMLEMAMGAADALFGPGRHRVADVTFERAMIVPDDATREIRIVTDVNAGFGIHSRIEGEEWIRHARGRLVQDGAETPSGTDLAAVQARCETAMAVPAFYAESAHHQVQLGPIFQVLTGVWYGSGETFATARGASDGFPLHPALLDSALQSVCATVAHQNEGTWLPMAVEAYERPVGTEFQVHAVMRADHLGDVIFYDAQGQPRGRLSGLLVGSVAASALLGRPTPSKVFVPQWQDLGPSTPATLEKWLRVGRDGLPADFNGEVGVVFEWPGGSAADGATALLRLAQALVQRPRPLVILTHEAQAVGSEMVQPDAAALWGLGRVLRGEHPELQVRLVDLPSGTPWSALPEGESELAWRNGHWYRLRGTAEAPKGSPPALHADATYLVTGGLGALGRHVARWLVAHGARHLMLLGRRPGTVELDADVTVAAVDVADRSALHKVLQAIPPDRPLRGVFHAAGVLDDGIVSDMTPERFHTVMAPKVDGARHLDELTRDLDFFVLFSSAAGLFGNPGQSPYAAANTFLDGLAQARHHAGKAAVSVAFGPWEDGLAAGQRRKLLRPLTPEDGLRLMELAMASGAPVVGAFPLDTAAWADMPVPTMLSEVVRAPVARVATPFSERLRGLEPEAQVQAIVEAVREEASRVMGLADIPADRPLRELGLDSLMAVEIRNALSQALGRPLAATVLFDYPTIEAMSKYLLTQISEAPAVTPRSTATVSRPVNEPIAIVGMACRFPGGVETPEAFWELLRDGREAVVEVPPDRWDVDAFYDPDPETPGRMTTRWGGFLNGVDGFDPAFFAITPREARSMDPQHRLLLETAWEAVERAGIDPRKLSGTPTGVFVGMCFHDYEVRTSNPTAIDGYTGLGTTTSMPAGRVAYALGLQGPTLTLDTACSSSLVSVHLACQALRNDECTAALAGGVNLMLEPHVTIGFSKLRVMSPTGHSRSFDAAADGYVRAEGCGMLLLKRLSQAQADGDPILGIVRGTAVNQNGTSQGLMAPNGVAQQDVLQRALRNAGVEPASIDFVECQSTGSSLADAIEVQALGAVMGQDRAPTAPVRIGSVKTNIGHAEGAAGAAAMIKCVLSLQHEMLPRTLHFQTPSPMVAWHDLPVEVVAHDTPWHRQGRPRRAGVSAFGMSGTNAHVVLEEPPAMKAPVVGPPRWCHLLVVSGRTPEAVDAYIERYRQWLPTSGAVADACYTAAVGRTPFPERAALLVSDSGEIIASRKGTVGKERLTIAVPATGFEVVEQAYGGKPLAELLRSWGVAVGESGRPMLGEPWQAVLTALGAAWMAGATLDWKAIEAPWHRRRLAVPTYPFQRQRYWIDRVPQAALPAAQTPTGILATVAGIFGLDPAQITPDMSLLELGLNSLAAAELHSRLSRMLGRPLSPTVALEHPTVGQLTTYLESLGTGWSEANGTVAEVSIEGDAERPLPQVPVRRAEDWRRPGGRVLLTGATGFLGGYLLRDLLHRSPAHVVCVARADNEAQARQRIEEKLRGFGLWEDSFGERMTCLPGDLEHPRLGLPPDQWASLCDSIDAVFHCAAWVNWVSPYPVLRAPNVEGTWHVLELACSGRLKPIHYVSTVGVFESPVWAGRVIAEKDEADRPDELYLGYTQSKWVAERLMLRARRHGVPVSVYRPALVSGDSRTGAWNTDDIVCRILKSLVLMNVMSTELDIELDLVPVDYASEAIVRLALKPDTLNKTFHLVNPEPLTWKALFDGLTAEGWPVEPMSYDRWLQRLDQSDDKNPLRGLAPILRERFTAGALTFVELQGRRAHFSAQETLPLLPAGLRCAPARQLLRHYLTSLIKSGYLPAPQTPCGGPS
ncbi:MAG TPA: thioester reductase domain-containing protein [Candidatus Xenobia bacterium]